MLRNRIEKVASYAPAPPNNGMHPTADTLLVMSLQRCGAAGDAGRSASTRMGYTTEDLIVFEPLFDPSARNGTSYFEFHPSELPKTNAAI